MFLSHVEIAGFRGLNRLSLSLSEQTLLIGENAWGKSSLLEALALMLSPQHPFYHFDKKDFYCSNQEICAEREVRLLFTFCQEDPPRPLPAFYAPLAPVLIQKTPQRYCIHYLIEGEIDTEGNICTWRRFLDEQGKVIPLDNINAMVGALIHLHPVIRLRDGRFIRKKNYKKQTFSSVSRNQFQYQLQKLLMDLGTTGNFPLHQEIEYAVKGIYHLITHYFLEESTALGLPPDMDTLWSENGSEKHPVLGINPIINQTINKEWRALNKLNQWIANQPSDHAFSALLLTHLLVFLEEQRRPLKKNPQWNLSPHARPLLLIEDPETRLHPIMLSIAWQFFSQLPAQYLLTSHSNPLASLIPIENICRLVRESDRVASYRLGIQDLSIEEKRRVNFHVHFNRPSALFARCWLLVEGETENWLLNELAKQSGQYFATEGIKVIEFAQCGLKPLIKFARAMGIEWHVLVDGDEAGKKYAAKLRQLLNPDKETESIRLTRLPAKNIEYFMYHEGFHEVYHHIAGIPLHTQIPLRKVIEKAIHHASKPDVAIAVAAHAKARGNHTIPLLLRKLFARVVWLARGQAD